MAINTSYSHRCAGTAQCRGDTGLALDYGRFPVVCQEPADLDCIFYDLHGGRTGAGLCRSSGWRNRIGVLDPILIAGFMAGCRALELDEEMEISHLMAGFRTGAGQLAAVGGYYLAGKMLLVMVAMGLAGIAIGPMPEVDFASLESMDPAQLELVVRHFMVVGALLMSLLIPLLMAFWFAPALVLFDRMTATQAMKASFTACLRNIWPFSLFGVAGSLLFLLGALPFGLGLLAVIPVLFGTSVYTAYRDIFVARAKVTEEA